jgi:hypothetical protein
VLHGICSTDLEMRECANGFVEHNATMVEDFLKLCRGFSALVCDKIGFSAHKNRVQTERNSWSKLAWEVVEVNQDSILARLDWGRPGLLALFPYPHKLQMAAALDPDALMLQTTVLASARSVVPVSFGFHPYFGIPRLPRQEWRVELPVMRRILLDARGIPRWAGTV